MNYEINWTYLYPSFGLLMRAFDMEAKHYQEGFALTPNRVTITYRDALNAYKFFVLHAINNSLTEELVHYDQESIYYSINFLMNIAEMNYEQFSSYSTTTEHDEKISLEDALSIVKQFMEISFPID